MLTRNFLSFLALSVAGALAACSSSSTPEAPSSSAETDGSLDLRLQVAGGVSLGSFSYVITGPAGFSRQGAVNVDGSNSLSMLVGALPVGTGFSVSLSAAADGALSCTGSAAFDITARATTKVTVRLQCHEPVKNGTAALNGDLNQCPLIDALGASPAAVLVGNQLALSGGAHDADAGPRALSYAWTASAGTLSDAATKEAKLTCTAAGDVVVTLSVSDGDCSDIQTATVSCTAPTGGGGVARVVINEVESNGGTPGDWVELYNSGTATADISGWKFKDNDDTHAFYVIPANTLLAPGAYFMLEEAQFGFGLGGADSARLWDATGAAVDSYSWTAHATSTYGRCPNGSGSFVATLSSKAAANDCGSSGGTGGTGSGGAAGAGGASGGAGGSAAGAGGANGGAAGAGGSGGASALPWPGTDAVVTVDEASYFGTNLSGLNYQPAAAGTPAVLWAAQNGPSKVFRLLFNGTSWVPDTENGWGSGKLLHYTNGTGAPDSEGLTKADWSGSSVYVSTERDNNANGVSRLSILRFDTSAATAELTALNDWNLTADLPAVGPNLGLEAITFVPDAALVAGGFVDDATHAPYNPATYANHGGGLFFVGVEGTGMVYGYALDHVTNGFVRVAAFASGQTGIMDLAYDRDSNYLWGYCDNTCGNKATVFRLDSTAGSATAGHFQISRVFDRPSTLPNSNNEGITFAPDAECSAGQKSFFWTDDDAINSHSLRRGTIACGAFF